MSNEMSQGHWMYLCLNMIRNYGFDKTKNELDAN
jgi:hypothetical protein